jgi:hypothetical protein
MSLSNTAKPAPSSPGRSAWMGGLMFGVRYVLPAAIVLAGAIIMAHGSEVDLDGGAEIVSAGLSVYLANWLFRIGYSSHEREDEEAGRDYLRAHGHWPDQPPMVGSAAVRVEALSLGARDELSDRTTLHGRREPARERARRGIGR